MAQIGRDARMVLDGCLGRTPDPLVRRPSRPGQPATARGARVLRVSEVVRETADAISFVLEDPAGRAISFQPGQFFTLLLDVGGRSYRRAYSACSSHRDTARVRLAVKRVAGGRVSEHLIEHLRAGQLVRVLGPSGQFVCAPRADAARHIVLIGGGSGITPLLAIAEAVLAGEPGSRVSLIYGNRSAADIVLRARLEALAAAYPARFALRHVLEQAPAPADAPAHDAGERGQLSGEVLSRVLAGCERPDRGGDDDGHASDGDGDEGGDRPLPRSYYLCGPAPMLAAARAVLEARGVVAGDIHEERFTQPHLRRQDAAQATGGRVRIAMAAGDSVSAGVHEFEVGAGQSVLDAALAAGVSLPFSCTMGGCGACKLRRRAGDLLMEEPNCLSTDERAAGYVLSCVGRPSGPVELSLGDAEETQ
ncbi:Oxidoreductase FAD-binding domain protein [Haliangium ochraceum DSM 14365]|uniref:Oxidoreductase FAD-binding domain protein n=2 Tax=Haliangium ochraceum TaxID=80816 RepID=D0LTN9_HALO1|nr:Oxidoreductase FAD-binding domain protein [Haliangium ochraceum DSM 14365]